MIVTINTDASFSRKHERGSFAFWIVCNDFKILKSGIIKKRCIRPEIAEFRCIVNALYVLSQQDTKKITRIIINTDCLNVIHLLTKNKDAIQQYKLASWGNYLVLAFQTLLLKFGSKCKVEYRHVRSHVTTEGARNWVNDWCDREAKKSLQELLQTLEKK